MPFPFDDAIDVVIYALQNHKDQEYAGVPVVFKHLFDVSNVLERFRVYDVDIRKAAYIHDAYEDTQAPGS